MPRLPASFLFAPFSFGAVGAFARRGAFVAAFAGSLFSAGAAWQDSLTPDVVGPYAALRPFEAEMRVGWTDIEAARAHVEISDDANGAIRLHGVGATTGLARALYQLDATIDTTTARDGFRTIYSIQQENYAKRMLITQIVARPDGIWRLRENTPPGKNPAKWKHIKISPLRDLFSAMLFIRSQPLATGETVSTIAFPGDSPFLVDMRSVRTGPVTIGGVQRDAIQLELRIRRINLKKDSRLEPHEKFRSGTVWLSNDADRLPLRAEVNIFVGYLFAELESVHFTGP